MSACAMLTYNNIDSSAWNCGVAVAAKYGVTISTNYGSATDNGYTVAWNYDPTSQVLQIQCTDSPWAMPCVVINGAIDHAVNDCLQQSQVVLTSMMA